MSILKYVDRLKRMDELIRRKGTGTAEEFAETLGISVSVLKENINEMRALGADIEFCRHRKSYCYKNCSGLLLKFEKSVLAKSDTGKIWGGNSFGNFF